VQFGDELSVPAAASLTGLPVRQTRRLVQELLGAQLLTEKRPGRYSMHDLLREYAEELAELHETPDALRAAQVRLLDHYLHVSHAARSRMTPLYDPPALHEPAAGVQLLEIADYDAARSWFVAEYPILPAAVRRATALGLPAYAWQLTWAFGKFQQQRGYWQDQLDAGRLALDATVWLRDRVGEARMRHIVAVAHSRAGRTDLGRSLLEEACRIQEELGDLRGQAVSWNALAMMVHGAGENDLALEYFERAAELNRAAGNRLGEGHVLNGIAWVACTTGDYDKAVDYGHRALTVIQPFDDPIGHAATWDTLGYAYHHLGRAGDALDCYQRALDYHGHVGDRYYEALVRIHIGDVQRDEGNTAAARRAWREAERLLAELDHADVADARRRLLELDSRALETADAP
jgi:tetratricopeptide (TPR) repeat protein